MRSQQQGMVCAMFGQRFSAPNRAVAGEKKGPKAFLSVSDISEQLPLQLRQLHAGVDCAALPLAAEDVGLHVAKVFGEGLDRDWLRHSVIMTGSLAVCKNFFHFLFSSGPSTNHALLPEAH